MSTEVRELQRLRNVEIALKTWEAYLEAERTVLSRHLLVSVRRVLSGVAPVHWANVRRRMSRSVSEEAC